jgi:hypothetical protein
VLTALRLGGAEGLAAVAFERARGFPGLLSKIMLVTKIGRGELETLLKQ